MRRSLLLAGLLLAGCDSYDFDTSGALLQTDAASYDAELRTDGLDRVEVTIPFVRSSPAGASTVYVGCTPPHAPHLQKRVEGEWVTAYAQVETLCLSAPFVLDAGATRTDTLTVVAYLPGQNSAPEFEVGDVPGTYRLVQSIYARADGDGQGRDLLPLEARVSNAFELR